MNLIRPSEAFHKIPHYAFQATGYLATVLVLALLVLAWMVTSPILRLLIFLCDWRRSRLPSPSLAGRECEFEDSLARRVQVSPPNGPAVKMKARAT